MDRQTMWKTLNLFSLPGLALLLLACVTRPATQIEGPEKVETREWSKNEGVVHYSGWKSLSAMTVDRLPGYHTAGSTTYGRYGGIPEKKTKATGFFHTLKTGDRWWIIDPDGNPGLNVAVNAVRPGTSERNKNALAGKFGDEKNWISQTHQKLISLGFNGTGSWSETRLVRYDNQNSLKPLSYTLIWNFFAGYQRQRNRTEKEKFSFPVFDPEFETYCDSIGKKLIESAEDPNLLGHFSDNELVFNLRILDEFLGAKDPGNPNLQVARKWLADSGLTAMQINDDIRVDFLGIVSEQYYKVVSGVIRKYDPNHMYLGSRLHGKPKFIPGILKSAGKYADIVSVNYYGYWEPEQDHFKNWDKWAGKPILITEFYTKGDDSGLPNNSGAGWRVKTQNDRGVFYENFCIKLIRMKNCVGWQWFRYMDNDPTDTLADPSNSDSNKGIVDNMYDYYDALTDHMLRLNNNRFGLIQYFDNENPHAGNSLP